MIVPIRNRRELRAERVCAKRHENDPRTFVLQTQDESFSAASRTRALMLSAAQARAYTIE
jgi:hypothetical protein